jgi:hypothetical protein
MIIISESTESASREIAIFHSIHSLHEILFTNYAGIPPSSAEG